MAYIQNEKITEILEKADIVEIVSKYVALKKAGRNYKGLCPFHREKTPSFHVSQEKQIFHCFGCGTGGNVFNFLMKIENIGFPEAVQLAATKVGIEIEISEDGYPGGEKRREIYEVNRIAHEFFCRSLETSFGRPAWEALEKRGFQEKDFKTFGLGYAPAGNKLLGYLKDKKLPLALCQQAGLIARTDDGFCDMFRHRIILPIFDIRGAVVGFGGRSMEENQQPKYLNSPENLIFRKGHILYGLNWAKEAIRKSGFSILVEGYFDLLKMRKSGIENVVAPLGTALTDSHLRLLKRYAEKVLLLFDPDQAGSTAALNNLEAVLKNGMEVKVATLPMGFDPEDFLDNFGTDAFLKVLNNAADFVDYSFALESQKYDAASARGKIVIADHILALIQLIPDELERSMYVKKLSTLTGLDAEMLATRQPGASRELPVVNEKQHPQVTNMYSLRAAELTLVVMIAENPELIRELAKYKDYFNGVLKEIVESYEATGIAPDNLAAVLAQLNDQTAADFVSRTAIKMPETDWAQEEKKKRIFDDCVQRIRREFCERRIRQLNAIISEKGKDGKNYDEELREIQRLVRQIKEPSGRAHAAGGG